MVTAEDPSGPPRLREHPSHAANSSAFEEIVESDLLGVTILVVDDEPDARALIARLLTDSRARVITAASAAEAFSILVDESPDILLSDIGMPGEDGYALIKRIRALPEKASLPAIALTAYARTDDRVKAIQAGYHMHLAKPVEPVELLAMLQSIAERTRDRAAGQKPGAG
jgi:CheY-like chemotaxis protein